MFGIFKSRLMWDGAGKGTLLQWYHAKGGAPKRDLFLVCYPSNYCIPYTIVIPSSKLTYTLLDRGWKTSFHYK